MLIALLRRLRQFVLPQLLVLASACSAAMPEPLPPPVWIEADSIGLLCRVNAPEPELARQLEERLCAAALARLKTSLSDAWSIDLLETSDPRLVQPNRVSLVFDLRLERHADSAFSGYTLTLASRQFRHKPGSPPAALFFEAPSVVMLPAESPREADARTLADAASAALEKHLRALLR